MAATANRYFEDVTQDMTESYAYQSADNYTDVIQGFQSDEDKSIVNNTIDVTVDVTDDITGNLANGSVNFDKFLTFSRQVDHERLQSASTELTASTFKNDNEENSRSASPNNGTTVIEKSTRGLRRKLDGSPPSLLYTHSTPIKLGSTSKSSHKVKDIDNDESRNDDTTFNDLFGNKQKDFKDEDTFINQPGLQPSKPIGQSKPNNHPINQPIPLAPRHFQLPYQHQFNRHDQSPDQETSPSTQGLPERDNLDEILPHEVKIITDFMDIFPRFSQEFCDNITLQLMQHIATLFPKKVQSSADSSEEEDRLGLERSEIQMESQDSNSHNSPGTTPPRSREFQKGYFITTQIQEDKEALETLLERSKMELEKSKSELERSKQETKIALEKVRIENMTALDKLRLESNRKIEKIQEENKRTTGKLVETEASVEMLRLENRDLKDAFKHLHHVDFSDGEDPMVLQSENVQLKKDLFLARKLGEKNSEASEELRNELNWLKSEKSKYTEPKHAKSNHTGEEFNQLKQDNQILQNQLVQARSYKETLQKELSSKVGDELQYLSMDSVPYEFRRFFEKYHLEELDTLLKVEVTNKLKNVMLTLLISDYDNLHKNCVKYAKFIKASMRFMDDIHNLMYIETNMRPSLYLKDGEVDQMQRCFDGMVRAVLRSAK